VGRQVWLAAAVCVGLDYAGSVGVCFRWGAATQSKTTKSWWLPRAASLSGTRSARCGRHA